MSERKPTKKCVRCTTEKDLDEFYTDKRHKDGHQSECIQCARERGHKNYKSNPEKYAAWSLKANYGISIEEYNNLLKLQNDLCACCGKSQVTMKNGKIRALYVDHDHKTGKVRSLLCHKCNSAIGILNESIDQCYLLIKYLLKFELRKE